MRRCKNGHFMGSSKVCSLCADYEEDAIDEEWQKELLDKWEYLKNNCRISQMEKHLDNKPPNASAIYSLRDKYNLKYEKPKHWQQLEQKEKVKEIIEECNFTHEAAEMIYDEFEDRISPPPEDSTSGYSKYASRVVKQALGHPISHFLRHPQDWHPDKEERLHYILKENPNMTYREIANEFFPDKSKYQIKSKAAEFDDIWRAPKKEKTLDYGNELTESQVETLREKSQFLTDQSLADMVFQDYTKEEILRLRQYHNIKKRERSRWTDEDIEKLKEAWTKMDIDGQEKKTKIIQQEVLPHHTYNSIRGKCSNLDLLDEMNMWTQDELGKVKEILKKYETTNEAMPEIQDATGRNIFPGTLQNVFRRHCKHTVGYYLDKDYPSSY